MMTPNDMVIQTHGLSKRFNGVQALKGDAEAACARVAGRPWLLPDVASAIALGAPPLPELVSPIVATAVWRLLFIGAMLWRFEGLEF
jgi:hypothetical protein